MLWFRALTLSAGVTITNGTFVHGLGGGSSGVRTAAVVDEGCPGALFGSRVYVSQRVYDAYEMAKGLVRLCLCISALEGDKYWLRGVGLKHVGS